MSHIIALRDMGTNTVLVYTMLHMFKSRDNINYTK